LWVFFAPRPQVLLGGTAKNGDREIPTRPIPPPPPSVHGVHLPQRNLRTHKPRVRPLFISSIFKRGKGFCPAEISATRNQLSCIEKAGIKIGGAPIKALAIRPRSLRPGETSVAKMAFPRPGVAGPEFHPLRPMKPSLQSSATGRDSARNGWPRGSPQPNSDYKLPTRPGWSFLPPMVPWSDILVKPPPPHQEWAARLRAGLKMAPGPGSAGKFWFFFLPSPDSNRKVDRRHKNKAP